MGGRPDFPGEAVSDPPFDFWTDPSPTEAGQELARLFERYPALVRQRVALARTLMRESASDPEALLRLRGIAHDLRGEGASFGYPAITRLAESLGLLLEARPDGAALEQLVDEHLGALDRIALERLAGACTAAQDIEAVLERRRLELLAGAAGGEPG